VNPSRGSRPAHSAPFAARGILESRLPPRGVLLTLRMPSETQRSSAPSIRSYSLSERESIRAVTRSWVKLAVRFHLHLGLYTVRMPLSVARRLPCPGKGIRTLLGWSSATGARGESPASLRSVAASSRGSPLPISLSGGMPRSTPWVPRSRRSLPDFFRAWTCRHSHFHSAKSIEAFTRSRAQAMRSKLPVVATASDGVPRAYSTHCRKVFLVGERTTAIRGLPSSSSCASSVPSLRFRTRRSLIRVLSRHRTTAGRRTRSSRRILREVAFCVVPRLGIPARPFPTETCPPPPSMSGVNPCTIRVFSVASDCA